MIRPFHIALVAAFCLIPDIVAAQSAQEDESEVLKSSSPSQALSASPDLKETAASIVRQTNTFRKDEGLSTLEVDTELESAAQYFADYMARTDKYGHTADGNRPADRAKKHGYDYCIVLENIAYHYSSAGFSAAKLGNQAFRGWKKSPGHRKNMLDPDVTQTGVAFARSEQTGYYYAVQMFGRPKEKAIEFSIANEARTTVDYEIAGREYTLPPRLTRTHTRCRPSKVIFDWPMPEGDTKVVTPRNGDQLKVVNADDGFQLKKE